MFFIRYSGSLIYDGVIIFVLFFVVTALCLLLNQGQGIPPATHWYQLTLMGITLTYYYTSINSGGQTLGMRAWRFKITTVTQDKLSKHQIGARALYFIPSLLLAPFYLSYSYTLLNRWTKTGFILV